jgi:hypothetical protein
MVFALTFPFTWFSLLILHVFAAVYLKGFWAISFIVRFCHSRFLKCFCGESCFDLLELSEAFRWGWNYFKLDFMNFKCLTTFSVYSLNEDTMVYIL